MRKSPRSAYVYSDDVGGIVHLPDAMVHDGELPEAIGFLAKHREPPAPVKATRKRTVQKKPAPRKRR